MVSSGGDDVGGGGGQQAFGSATPMADVPISGGPGMAPDPTNYGRFQSFRPKSGSDASATGLTPEMFQYRTPQEVLGGASGGAAPALRQQLAAAMAQPQGVTAYGGGDPFYSTQPDFGGR